MVKKQITAQSRDKVIKKKVAPKKPTPLYWRTGNRYYKDGKQIKASDVPKDSVVNVKRKPKVIELPNNPTQKQMQDALDESNKTMDPIHISNFPPQHESNYSGLGFGAEEQDILNRLISFEANIIRYIKVENDIFHEKITITCCILAAILILQLVGMLLR